MKVLIVFTEPYTDLDCLKLKNTILQKIKDFEWEIQESDLFEMDFCSAISLKDYKVNANSIRTAQDLAYPNGYSEDIMNEMAKIVNSNIVIVVTKLYEGLLPTLFIGWFQRIFVVKFAVFSQDQVLHGKKFMFFVNAENEEERE